MSEAVASVEGRCEWCSGPCPDGEPRCDSCEQEYLDQFERMGSVPPERGVVIQMPSAIPDNAIVIELDWLSGHASERRRLAHRVSRLIRPGALTTLEEMAEILDRVEESLAADADPPGRAEIKQAVVRLAHAEGVEETRERARDLAGAAMAFAYRLRA